MIGRIPTPRLLPATIAMMGTLLAVKFGVLLQAAVMHGARPASAMVAAAHAASTERAPEAGPEHSAERPKPAGGAAKASEKAGVQRAAAASSPPAPAGPPQVSDSERALLQDLRQRRQELDTRAAAVNTRESVLTAAEQKVTARVGELQALQKQLEGLDAAQKQKEDAGWQGLVKLYEAMKPRDAATIFNDLQMAVLLQVLDRMKDSKAALIMAAMNPEKARDVTAELAQMRTGRETARPAPAASRPNQTGS